MRTKISDWKVGEKVIFISAHTNNPTDMVVMSVGRKILGVGSGTGNILYKFRYENNELCSDNEYCHCLYLPEEYDLMIEYKNLHTEVVRKIGMGLRDKCKYTEENIKRLAQILELVRAIKA